MLWALHEAGILRIYLNELDGMIEIWNEERRHEKAGRTLKEDSESSRTIETNERKAKPSLCLPAFLGLRSKMIVSASPATGRSGSIPRVAVHADFLIENSLICLFETSHSSLVPREHEWSINTLPK
jgi:hypothetical protein